MLLFSHSANSDAVYNSVQNVPIDFKVLYAVRGTPSAEQSMLCNSQQTSYFYDVVDIGNTTLPMAEYTCTFTIGSVDYEIKFDSLLLLTNKIFIGETPIQNMYNYVIWYNFRPQGSTETSNTKAVYSHSLDMNQSIFSVWNYIYFTQNENEKSTDYVVRFYVSLTKTNEVK